VREQFVAGIAALPRIFHHGPWAMLLVLGALSFFSLPWGLGFSAPYVIGFGLAVLALACVLAYRLPRVWTPARHADRWFTVILVLGFLLRVAYVLVVPPVQVSDMLDYVELARTILKGEGYHQVVFGHDFKAFRAPGYSFLLAAVMALVGDTSWAPALLNLLCYVLTALVLRDLATRLAGPEAGIAASAMFSCWPSGIMTTGLALTEQVSLLLLLGVAWGIARARADRRWRWWIVTGVSTGLGALVRPSLLPLPGLLLLLAVLDPRDRSANLRHAICATLVAVLCVAPWTIRNYRVLDALVVVSTNGGDILYRANNSLAGGGYTTTGEEDFSGLLPDEVAWNRATMAAGKRWIAEHPMGFLRLGVRKLAISLAEDTTGAYWSLERAHQQSGPIYAAAKGISNMWWLGVWIICFVALARERTRLIDHPDGVTLMWLTIVLPVVHAVFEAQPRYHMPIVGVLLCLAAVLFARPQDSSRP
jgi:4-amino-4-deoxy-L-arabinose transferase-like glycosyltransferase